MHYKDPTRVCERGVPEVHWGGLEGRLLRHEHRGLRRTVPVPGGKH